MNLIVYALSVVLPVHTTASTPHANPCVAANFASSVLATEEHMGAK